MVRKVAELRPANSLSGESVNFFDAQIHFLHQANHVEYRKCTDTVADEVGCVLGDHDTFAELTSQKCATASMSARSARGWESVRAAACSAAD